MDANSTSMTPHPHYSKEKCLQTLPDVPWGQNCPLLRTTVLGKHWYCVQVEYTRLFVYGSKELGKTYMPIHKKIANINLEYHSVS